MGLSQNKPCFGRSRSCSSHKLDYPGQKGCNCRYSLDAFPKFRHTPHFWLSLQMDYELDVAEDSFEAKIEKEVIPMSAVG
jgi:hypothetical protein